MWITLCTYIPLRWFLFITYFAKIYPMMTIYHQYNVVIVSAESKTIHKQHCNHIVTKIYRHHCVNLEKVREINKTTSNANSSTKYSLFNFKIINKIKSLYMSLIVIWTLDQHLIRLSVKQILKIDNFELWSAFETNFFVSCIILRSIPMSVFHQYNVVLVSINTKLTPKRYSNDIISMIYQHHTTIKKKVK